MEYHYTNVTDVVMQIYEKGLDPFSDEVEFMLRYLSDVELRLDTTRSDDLNDLEGSGEVER